MKIYWMVALTVMSAGLIGCEYVLPTRPVLGYETDDGVCSDGRDNDEDGLIDCDDPDCVFGSTQCGEDVPLIPNLEPEEGITCHDQIDNDDNGQFDCGDPACNAVLENCCSREFSDETCSDGLDNDGNGYVDCEDFGCRNDPFGFVTVCDTFSSGGSDCVPTGAGTETTLAECSDGLDNDCNGYTDCDDFACYVRWCLKSLSSVNKPVESRRILWRLVRMELITTAMVTLIATTSHAPKVMTLQSLIYVPPMSL